MGAVPPHRPDASGRLVGIDVARWLALIGMIAVHTMPERGDDGSLLWVEHAFSGRSSALFAVLLGVSLALMTGGSAPLQGQRLSRGIVGIVVRAVLVGGIGLALGELDSGIAVILASYAVLMVVSCAFLAVPWRILLAVAVSWCLAGPFVSLFLRGLRAVPTSSLENPTVGMLDDPVGLLTELSLTGYYPALTWLAYAMLGIAIGRMPLRSTRVAAWLLGIGAAVVALIELVGTPIALAAGINESTIDYAQTALSGVTPAARPELLALSAPHSGTPMDLLTTCASAAAAIGACLLLVAGLRRLPHGDVAVRTLAVALGAGTATLTLYSLHVWLRTPDLLDGEGYATFAAHVGVISLAGAALVAAGRRGPLEWVTGWLARRAAGTGRS